MSETSQGKAPRWAWWVATGLGSGCLRPAPGTWGSLAALLAWSLGILGVHALRLDQEGVVVRGALEFGLFAVIGLLGWIGVQASTLVAREAGREDPGFIVVDEWLGMWVTLWPLRWELARAFEARAAGAMAILLGVPFLVFRVLDIWKPWPVYQIQDLPEGQGIMADDLVAGLYGVPVVMFVAPMLLSAIR